MRGLKMSQLKEVEVTETKLKRKETEMMTRLNVFASCYRKSAKILLPDKWMRLTNNTSLMCFLEDLQLRNLNFLDLFWWKKNSQLAVLNCCGKVKKASTVSSCELTIYFIFTFIFKCIKTVFFLLSVIYSIL